MPFVFLLLFALICLQSPWPEPPDWLTAPGCAMIVGTIMLASWLTAWLISRVLAWQMIRDPDRRIGILRGYGRWRRWHLIGLLAAYLASLYWLGWGHVVIDAWKSAIARLSDTANPNLLPGAEIAILAPFLIGLLLAWERFYQVERTAYDLTHLDHFIPRFSYLLLQVRHQMLLVMPPMLLLLLQQFLFTAFPSLQEESYLPAAILGVMLVAAFISMPLLLRLFLGLKPLPPGPLRDRLEHTARRLGFGYSNVLVWHTRHLFANAMVTGFVPWVRYIVLTDRLIDELTPDEIEAVFGHEVGHIKHHHLLFYLAFFLASFLLLSMVWDQLLEWARQSGMTVLELAEQPEGTLQMVSSFLKLGLLAVYTLLFFGFISRRCERQADLFGASTVSTDIFISALEKVADINGIPRHRSGNWLLSWQHPTIAQRVEFLMEMGDHPDRIPHFHRSISVMQWAVYLALGCLLYEMWAYQTVDMWTLLSGF